MKPEDVDSGLVEKAARAQYAADPYFHLGVPIPWDELDLADIQEMRNNARHALAAVLPEVQAQAWDEGLEYARAEARGELQHYRKEVGPGTVMATDTQPVFDAIDGAGTRFNYRTYNAHIHSVTLMGLLDLLTPAPRIEVDGDVYEADEDPNPHRAARARLELIDSEEPTT